MMDGPFPHKFLKDLSEVYFGDLTENLDGKRDIQILVGGLLLFLVVHWLLGWFHVLAEVYVVILVHFFALYHLVPRIVAAVII